MLVSRCVVPLSLGTFIKHLPISKRTTFCPYRIRPKTITTTRILCSSYFETLDSHQKEQIHLYVDTLLEWNQRMNLTAVKEVNEVMERHIEDSLAIIPPIRNSYLSHCSPSSSNNLSLVDVGSGAGLPGLVLAIACPGWEVTLMESMKKRCLFLEHVVSHIGLSNVQIVRGRAENLGQALCFREKFDVAVARAVAEMRVLAEYCLPLGLRWRFVCSCKGAMIRKVEVRNAEKAIQILGASVLQLCPGIPYGQRTAIVCLKTSPTPRKYPRDPGTPEKTPL
ncbi:unnamed protein product [Prunus armeniaca]|uniref:Ribosomal RNA small subunit methyltransferase G n=1 Tax=Prunus armeniaca TaxID=36596 RepID=A0A6J5UY22_PRUAR|nr:unnamed protein product [Prunus armeniaca]